MENMSMVERKRMTNGPEENQDLEDLYHGLNIITVVKVQ